MGAVEYRLLCPADLNGDGALDIFDFLLFVYLFNGQDSRADCLADFNFDLFDFLCFVNAFNAGCRALRAGPTHCSGGLEPPTGRGIHGLV